MNLYFMRHGIAVDRADSGAGSGDRERQLTPKGIKRMNKAAKGLATLSLYFRSNPHQPSGARAPDCQDRGAVPALGRARRRNRAALTRTIGPRSYCPAWSPTRGKKEILLVGHEPQLSSTISVLLSGTSGAVIRLKKGGLCCLQVDGLPPRESAVLHWALTPKQLRLMAR